MATSHMQTHDEVIAEVGSALHRHSAGLPLHLVYSLEALLKSGEPLTVDAVHQLPACPSGEIETTTSLFGSCSVPAPSGRCICWLA